MDPKLFIVTARNKYPAWNEKEGLRYEVTARTKTEANKIARRRAENDGYFGGGSRWTFTAKEG